ncbi:hypothetical protein WS86_16045 [Burkholderia savannae]|nr:hypothetical protein WS86_16045 [Burkholderia savannae]
MLANGTTWETRQKTKWEALDAARIARIAGRRMSAIACRRAMLARGELAHAEPRRDPFALLSARRLARSTRRRF